MFSSLTIPWAVFILAFSASPDAALTDLDATVAQAREALEDGRPADARHLLAAADRKWPRSGVVAYYLAYCDYKEGRFAEAQRGFEAALGLDPADAWAAYMAALSQAKAGHEDKARERLRELQAAHADDEVGKTAAGTLRELDVRHASRPGPWSATAEVGALIDTNPAFRAESAGDTHTDGAISAAAYAEYGVLRTPAHRLVVGGGASETAYVVRRDPTDWTAFSAWAAYRWSGAMTAWLASYRFGFSLYGYDPFTSAHSVSTGARVSEATWTLTVIDLEGALRVAHDRDFAFLDARAIGLTVLQEFEPVRMVRLRAGLATRYEDADPAAFRQEETVTDEAGADHVLTGDYRTDFSFAAVGPTTSMTVRLAHGLLLEASTDLTWRWFVTDDHVVYADNGTVTAEWRKRRQDLVVQAAAALRWAFDDHLALALRAAFLRNVSTIGGDSSDPVDRNYQRWMVGLWLRWALSPVDL